MVVKTINIVHEIKISNGVATLYFNIFFNKNVSNATSLTLMINSRKSLNFTPTWSFKVVLTWHDHCTKNEVFY